MQEKIADLTGSLAAVAAAAKDAFGELSYNRLNWKPSEKSWSVAQCLDHLITTHSLYFPLFTKLAEDAPSMSRWENYSPFSRFFGRFLIKGLDPANLKPMRTTSRAYPAASEINPDIISRFCTHQNQMIGHLRNLPDDMDATRRVITSPLLGFVTYTLDDTFTIIDYHCRRHFNQAERVTKADGFPAL